MDEFDLKIAALLSTLAAIVNSAHRPEETAGAVRGSKVPTKLLYEAKGLLKDWGDTEYGTDAIRNAARRSLEQGF